MPKVDTFSYASEEDSAVKRLVIQIIERISGQPELKRLYLEHQNDPRPRESFWNAAVRKLQLQVEFNRDALSEIPREGAAIIGIAWKNKRDEAASWLKRLGDPFKSAGLDLDGKMGLDWGLSGVPETYAIDGNGIVRMHFRGPITERDLTENIIPFLKGTK